MAEYAILIEPDLNFKNEILKEKKRVRANFGTQPYLSHPPHSTLYFSKIEEREDWLKSFQKQLSNFFDKSLPISIKEKLVFRNDILAGGGDTIVFKAELTEELSKLQIYLSECLKDLSISKNNSHSFKGLLASSYEAYGFPFVGEHWIPHFTVASINDESSKDYIEQFLAKSYIHEFEISSVSVWKVNGDEHKKISEIRVTG